MRNHNAITPDIGQHIEKIETNMIGTISPLYYCSIWILSMRVLSYQMLARYIEILDKTDLHVTEHL